ncbi:MAG: HD-GYP domain-containing protein [Trueperaceae bacterium]|nr:HD-GYP domain-containing protein [Trueperaceae bacterium]
MLNASSYLAKPNWSIHSILPPDLLRQSWDGWHLGLLDGHALRVAAYSYVTAKALGLSDSKAEELRTASAFHDIGKLMIPEDILDKPGLLNNNERARVEAHTLYGYEMLRDSSHQLMEQAALIALHHHEKVDGSGYPYGLNSDEIPLYARIVSVCDVFDALSTDRAYREALPEKKVMELLWQGAGSHFDRDVLHAFAEALEHYPDLGNRLRTFCDFDVSRTNSAIYFQHS